MTNAPQLSSAIEQEVVNRVLADPGLSSLKAAFIGEPGFGVPVSLHPFLVIHVLQINEARGEEGYGNATATRYWRYDGYVSVDVTLSDIRTMSIPPSRISLVPSYDACRSMTQIALGALQEWSDDLNNDLPAAYVVSADGKEQTVELMTDSIRLGMTRRDNATTNRGAFEFHIYSRRFNS